MLLLNACLISLDDAKSYYHMRALKEQNILEAAVDSCIEAAGHEFDIENQKKLLGAASFGKVCLFSSLYSSCNIFYFLTYERFYPCILIHLGHGT